MNFLERWLEDPVHFALLKRGFTIGLVAVVVIEVVAPRVFHGAHHHFGFERIPAWGSLYGFLSCIAIIVVSKFIGKAWLMRREDHYDS